MPTILPIRIRVSLSKQMRWQLLWTPHLHIIFQTNDLQPLYNPHMHIFLKSNDLKRAFKSFAIRTYTSVLKQVTYKPSGMCTYKHQFC